MKRFSWRSTALLMVPCLIFPLAALLALRFAPTRGGIEVQKSARRAPTALDFSRGATVSADLKLNERPDDNRDITWQVVYGVTAGKHRLWDSQTGDGERKLSVSSHGMDGAWHEWNTNFDLKQVPPGWGAVVLRWQAHLRHGRTFSLGFKEWAISPENSSRSGEIVLRKADEKLDYSSKISHNPHLKFVDYEIIRLKGRKVGAIYRVILLVQRDAIGNEGMGRRLGTQVALTGIRADGMATGYGATSGKGEDYYNFASSDAGKANLLSSVTTDFDLDELPCRGRVEAEISFGDFWPLKISVPFSDEKGRVFLKRSRVKISGKYVG